MALNDLVTKLDATLQLAKAWADLALSPGAQSSLAITAQATGQANINLSYAKQLSIDLQALAEASKSAYDTAKENDGSSDTTKALQVAAAESSKAADNASASLKSIDSLVQKSLDQLKGLTPSNGEDTALPNSISTILERLSGEAISIGQTANSATNANSQSSELVKQITNSLNLLDQIKLDLGQAIDGVRKSLNEIGAPQSPGLSALQGLKSILEDLISEASSALVNTQGDLQPATITFAKVVEIKEIIQRALSDSDYLLTADHVLKAALVSSQALNYQRISAPIQSISLVELADSNRYAIDVGNNLPLIAISFNGQYASKNNPGAGWEAIAVAPSKSGSQYELIWQNSGSKQFVSWKLDANGVLIKGDLLAGTNLQVAELLVGEDLDRDGSKGPFAQIPGTGTDDILSGGLFRTVYGFDGKDTLTSASNNFFGFDILIGGRDGDQYAVPLGQGSLIADGGNSTGDALIAPELNLNQTTIATLQGGRHLVLRDASSNTAIYLYDWEKQENRIEILGFKGETFSYDQFKSRFSTSNPKDYEWGQWDQIFGGGHLSHSGLASSESIDTMLSSYSSSSNQGFLG